MVAARGRSFKARTWGLSDDDRENAFLRHTIGPWPMLYGNPGEPLARLQHIIWQVRSCFTCLGEPEEPMELEPLHWLPSFVPPVFTISAILIGWLLTYCLFFFSSSFYLHEV